MNAVSRVPPIDPDDPATQQKVRETLSRIEGWLADAAAHFTAWLMMRQNAEGTAGSVLELGVYRGKYLALLYGCSAPMARRVVGVDLFAGEDSRHNRAAIAAVKDTMRSAWGDSDRLELIAADTLKLTATRLMDALAAKAAFVSVDGGHEAIHLENDIDLAAQVLAPGVLLRSRSVTTSCSCAPPMSTRHGWRTRSLTLMATRTCRFAPRRCNACARTPPSVSPRGSSVGRSCRFFKYLPPITRKDAIRRMR